MNGSGTPSAFGSQDNGYWGDSFDASTDWFTPVTAATQTSVGVLDPTEQDLVPANEPDGLPSGLEITQADVLEALGPDADDLLASADVDVDEIIRLLNAETTVLPPLALPEEHPEADEAEMVEAITTWKRRFLKGAVTAVILTLTGSGAAAAAMDKSVTVEIDGQERTVNTYDSTVGEVLEEEGIEVGKHDALSPSPQSEVGHGDTITLDRGRQLTVTVDGEQRQEWVRSVSVGQALNQLGVDTEGASVSADRSAPVPEQGMEVVVKTAKTITITDGGGEPKELTTHAVTIDEFVAEQKLKLGPEDHITPGASEKITDGTEVHVNRTGSSVVNVTTEIEPPVKEIVDDSMFKGEEKVVEAGSPGEKIVFTRVSTRNGEETGREAIGERVTKEPVEKVVRVGGKPRPNSAVWDKLVECEAGGNWSANTGNGYYGGLQFDKSTWDAYGGDEFAAYPHQASREQQIQVATEMRDARGGYGAWPSCSSKLGLS
ncbi:transglycosylase family protein [Parasphingorhabdus pacifica]